MPNPSAKPVDLYTPEFFSKRRSWPAESAAVVVPLICELTGCKSIVDVGCGTGTWLAAFARAGAADVLGIDGDYVDRTQLEIDPERFVCRDLSKPFAFDRTFDLAVCLEVAEHLPASSAAGFVDSICTLSKIAMFSAAVPHQGGTGHINTQWQSYWAGLFAERKYVAIDFIRPAVWRDERVASWYAQNTLLYVQADLLASNERLATASRPAIMDVIHPGQYTSFVEKAESLRTALHGHAGAKAAVRHAVRAVGGALRRRVFGK